MLRRVQFVRQPGAGILQMVNNDERDDEPGEDGTGAGIRGPTPKPRREHILVVT
jgi:hypothetical protein